MTMKKQSSSSSSSSSSWCYLPEDLLFTEILPKLPTKAIVGLKSVCRNWHARITSDPTFIAAHSRARARQTSSDHIHIMSVVDHNLHCYILKHFVAAYDIDDSPLLVELHIRAASDMILVGSGNGLLCFQSFRAQTYELVIWNPVTNLSKRIPTPAGGRPKQYYFGMDTGSPDYKVVCLEEESVNELNPNPDMGLDTITSVHAKVLSKTTNTWRQFNNAISMMALSCINGQGLTLDGTMYWLMEYDEIHPLGATHVFQIFSFDLQTEKFQELQGPPLSLLHGHRNKSFRLIEWKGCLSAVYANYSMNVWQFFMKTNHNNWTSITINTPTLAPYECVGFLRDRFILSKFNASNRYLYDPATGEITQELQDDLGPLGLCVFTTFAHIHTLVSPF